MTWKYQMTVLKQQKDIPTPNDIVLVARRFKKPRDQALFIILYLTAARISEVIGTLYRKDINKVELNSRSITLFRLNNRKNPKRFFKDVPIPYDKEKELMDILNPWLDTFDMESMLFPFSKTRGYQIMKKNTGWNPHWLRHLRLTHLAVYQDMNDQLLSKFAGWSDSRPSKSYVEMKWKDILQKY